MKIYFAFVSYNSMGGHPTLSYLGDLILGPSVPNFGTAINQIDVYAHVQTEGLPLPTLDDLWERFRERVVTMPMAWFRRKTRLLEIAYFSPLGFANDLIQGRSRHARVEDVPLVRVAYRELIPVLGIVRQKVKDGDDFDASAFLNFLTSRQLSLDNESDESIQKWLLHFQELERQRVATSDDN